MSHCGGGNYTPVILDWLLSLNVEAGGMERWDSVIESRKPSAYAGRGDR